MIIITTKQIFDIGIKKQGPPRGITQSSTKTLNILLNYILFFIPNIYNACSFKVNKMTIFNDLREFINEIHMIRIRFNFRGQKNLTKVLHNEQMTIYMCSEISEVIPLLLTPIKKRARLLYMAKFSYPSFHPLMQIVFLTVISHFKYSRIEKGF